FFFYFYFYSRHLVCIVFVVIRFMKSKRNKLAGKHPSYKKRGMTPEQIKKKNEYQKKYNKTKSAVKHRVQLNKENRKRGTYGNGDGKDVSHSSDGKKL